MAVVAVFAAYAQKPVRKPQKLLAPYWTSEPGDRASTEEQSCLGTIDRDSRPAPCLGRRDSARSCDHRIERFRFRVGERGPAQTLAGHFQPRC